MACNLFYLATMQIAFSHVHASNKSKANKKMSEHHRKENEEEVTETPKILREKLQNLFVSAASNK